MVYYFFRHSLIPKFCFCRSSTRPEIAAIHYEQFGDDSHCSRSAVVVATSRVPNRKTAVVIAQDPGNLLTIAIVVC